MEYELSALVVHSEETADGRIICSIGFSNDGSDPIVDAAALEWHGEDGVQLWVDFSLSAILDDRIDAYQLVQEPAGTVEEEARPLMAAMRAELLAMVAKIDALEYG
jgi:hypothetical protein